MNGELAGCNFKWEFSPTPADPIKFYDTITEPTIGCLTLLLRNQSRLVQLLEAKDQEIQDYTLNGAVLSRKSLQTTIFDPKKEALTIPYSFPGVDLFDGLESPEYSEALAIFRKSGRPKDVFIAPGPPTMSKTDLDNKASSSLTLGSNMRKRGHVASSSTASVMKGPRPLLASQRQSQAISEEKSQETPQILQQDNSNVRQQPEHCSSPQQVKRTRASRTSTNASKNLLKKL